MLQSFMLRFWFLQNIEKDRRSPSICRSAAVFVIGLAENLQQALHDTRGSIFLSLQLLLNIDNAARLVPFKSLGKHSQSQSGMFLVHVTKDRQVILRS